MSGGGTACSTQTIWINWATAASGTTGNVTSDNTWELWSAVGTAGATTTTIWTTWVGGVSSGGIGSAGGNSYGYVPRELTKEQREAMEARRKVQEREAKEREAKRLKAERNALKLFVGIVGKKAYAQFKKRKFHELFGHSGKRYRVRLGGRVEEMAGNFGDQIAAYLCIHSEYKYGLPPMDTLIQQMLLVMSGEEGEQVLHKTANRTTVAA